jgi:hypothetical protein
VIWNWWRQGMIRARRRVFAALFGVLFLPVATSAAQDLQVWNEIDFAVSWRAIAITTPVILATDSSLPNPQFVVSGLTVDASLPWHITMSGGYVFLDLPTGAQSLVRIPLLAASGAFRVRRLVGTDRNRVEKLMGLGSSPVRYRNRLSLDLTLDDGGAWHVFGDGEFFFDGSTSKWTQNRLRFGAGHRLSARNILDVYCLRRSVSGVGTKTYVVGTTLKIDLTDAARKPREP